MNRYVALAFLAGALAGALVLKLMLDRRAAQSAASSDGAAAGSASSGSSGLKSATSTDDPAALRDEVATLRARVAQLEKELSDAKLAAGSGAEKRKRDRAKQLKELAAAIVKAKKDADATGGPMKNDTWIGPLLVLAGDLAVDLGVSVGEAIYSPDWYPMLAMTVMSLSPHPPTAEQQARFDEIISGARTDWDAFVAGREGMSNLEKGLALRGIQTGMLSQLATVGSPEQASWFGSLNLQPPAPPIAGVWMGAGPRENCRANLEKNWQKSLGLDGAQLSSLGPVMDDYMRAYEGIQSESALKKKAGEPYDDVTAKIELMLAMQKRVGETVRLTEAQSKAVKEWNSVYDYQVKE